MILKHFGKLKGRSIDELSTRLWQGVCRNSERLLPGLLIRIPEIDPRILSADILGLDRARIVDILNNRFPDERDRIIFKADAISGGRFDFLGYERLDFGSPLPDWHFDPVSGKRSPRVHWSNINEISAELTGDKKVIWELNRHQYFLTLGQAYWLTGDEKYTETFVRHIESWFNENPPKIGVNWLSSLELAFRSISWIWAYYFFRDSPAFEVKTLKRMTSFLYVQARHIETNLSTYFSPNTHLTGEALGLYMIGTFMSGLTESGKWREKGYQIFLKMLDVHIRDDGTYCEQASHYARYTADLLATLFVIRQRENLPIDGKSFEKLEKLYEFLVCITQPNGETPFVGDDDGGRLYFLDGIPLNDFRPALALGAVLFGRGDFKYIADSQSAELLWLLGPRGLTKFDSMKSNKPSEKSRAFKTGGFYSMRDSWKSNGTNLLILCGPHGFMNCGHAHADALSFVMSFSGDPIFVDSGTYTYTADLNARELYRSSSAHNCLTVNGKSSSIPDGPFSWKTKANSNVLHWHANSAEAKFVGRHDGFRSFGVEYRRELLFEYHGLITLTDTIESAQINSFELNFLLSPTIDADITDSQVALKDRRSGVTKLVIRTEACNDGKSLTGNWSISDWLLSPIYGKQIESKKLVYTVSAKGKVEVKNRIFSAI